jgi:polyferredoxin
VIFPWIGFSISIGMFIRSLLKGKKKILGRKIAILMILPCLLIFIPVINNENFQLEGVVLIVLVGLFSKGFIHYAIAKIFGPLIWGRGFCGWACWTAAILDWLPIANRKKHVDPKFKLLRFVTLFISIAIPVYLVVVMNYDVWGNYINKNEMIWMFTGNLIYYAIGIPLAFILNDKRAFCKYLCPVSLVMIPTSKISLITIKPTGIECIECGNCNRICPMDIDVMSYVKNNKKITHSECILCTDCQVVCPTGAI